MDWNPHWLLAALDNPLDHLPGAIGGGAVSAVVTSLVWGYILKRREDRKDREQGITEAQVMVGEYRQYAALIKDNADRERARMEGELSVRDDAIAELKNRVERAEIRLKQCEDDRAALNRFRRRAENRLGIRPEDYLEDTPPESRHLGEETDDDS